LIAQSTLMHGEDCAEARLARDEHR
jgi:hypothetical protein